MVVKELKETVLTVLENIPELHHIHATRLKVMFSMAELAYHKDTAYWERRLQAAERLADERYNNAEPTTTV